MLGSPVINGKITAYGSQLLPSCVRMRIFGDPICKNNLLKNGNEVGGTLNSPRRLGCPLLTRIERTETRVSQERVPCEQQSCAHDVDRASETDDEVLTEREH